MGALKGSISVRRYLVTDKLPADARKKLVRGLKAHAFTPIDPKTDVDRSIGWVSILDSEDTELVADSTLFVATGGEQLRVSMRMDVLKPSSAEVRRQLDTKVRAGEAEEKRKLTKRERRELKDEIARQLRLRTLPRVKTFDVVWNLDTGRLYLWSQTKTVNEYFLDLFLRSFSLKLTVEGPSLWARDVTDATTLGKLEPTPELWMGFEGVRPLTGNIVEEG
ncbi:MAG: recombination-associated protein RdgC [Polyangia bacterium]